MKPGRHMCMDNPGDDMPPSRALRDALLMYRRRQEGRRRAWRRAASWFVFLVYCAGCAFAGYLVASFLWDRFYQAASRAAVDPTVARPAAGMPDALSPRGAGSDRCVSGPLPRPRPPAFSLFARAWSLRVSAATGGGPTAPGFTARMPVAGSRLRRRP